MDFSFINPSRSVFIKTLQYLFHCFVKKSKDSLRKDCYNEDERDVNDNLFFPEERVR